MLLKETLRKLAEIQSSEVNALDQGTRRDLLDTIDMASPLAVIISGIRRCGKSTLLKQIMKKNGDLIILISKTSAHLTSKCPTSIGWMMYSPK